MREGYRCQTSVCRDNFFGGWKQKQNLLKGFQAWKSKTLVWNLTSVALKPLVIFKSKLWALNNISHADYRKRKQLLGVQAGHLKSFTNGKSWIKNTGPRVKIQWHCIVRRESEFFLSLWSPWRLFIFLSFRSRHTIGIAYYSGSFPPKWGLFMFQTHKSEHS